MLFSFKHETPTRNYDITAAGFTPIPVKTNLDSQPVKSNVGAIKDLAALFSAILLSALAYGMLMVMIALKAEQFIKNEVLISISSAAQIFAGIVFSRYLPAIGKKLGLINTVLFGSLLSAISAILLYFYFDFFLWVLVVYIYGTSLFICGVTRQTIMIDLAPQNLRALVISLGGMIVAIGNGLGPIFLNLIDTGDSFYTFAISCFLFLLSIIPLSRLKNSVTNIREEKKIGIWRYIKNSPKIMFAGFAVNYVISSTSAFLIIYGIKVGMPKSQASLLISVLLFGSIFSIPIGYMVDIFNRRFLMIFSSALSLLLIIIISLTQNNFSEIYILLFITFGCLIGMKLSAVVLINDKYKPTQRLAVNSAFSRISLSGNLIGLFATGVFMKYCGAQGLWISTTTILSLFLTFCTINYYGKFRRGELSFNNLTILHKKEDEISFEN